MLQIYREEWYKDYLNFNYSEVEITNNAKKLYYGSLRTGNIYKIYQNKLVKKLPIKGINCNRCGLFDESLVLTFDQKLYLCNDGEYKLVDKNVIDIDNSSYITDNKCYFIDNITNIKFELIIKSEGKFIKHRRLYQFLYVLKSDLLYIICLNKYLVNTINFNNAIDIGIITKNICVLQSDGQLFFVDHILHNKILCTSNVKKINDVLVDQKYIISKYKDSFKTNELPNKSDKALLVNDSIISLNKGTVNMYEIVNTRSPDFIQKIFYNFELTENVKNIYSDGIDLYILI